MSLKLILGNKNYSSWSLRPWIAMRNAGIPFEEEVIPLYEPGSVERMATYSPTGKVPVLLDGDMVIWESLAILDHIAERFPKAQLWPDDQKARAHARAISAEMHAGFLPLRRHCPMNMRRESRKRELTGDVAADVRRIERIWTECRECFGDGGPFLFGAFGAADAMYAPIVSRFASYAIGVGAAAEAYMAAVMALPAWVEWRNAGIAEPWVMPGNEV
ncbi:glutathione S-transferase family protein [Pseudorhodoplanes sinuspersici]|uniref:Glutathione S-transferase n=1 Tax=Pseudorhodoplanes sinuspersici TaxID=1235591 RepID=A0A1W6ZVH7_9HYPH|nr:glutathione S-transferase family protein [Pseudorhodoplanes sinuspersici]ARQ01439.1 glutathione S-transferase [Pseudorhodoplanes sinuspersici]RKE73129.1 glutathione S-transferase [Pseudorhodoplanes sinuspersici]